MTVKRSFAAIVVSAFGALSANGGLFPIARAEPEKAAVKLRPDQLKWAPVTDLPPGAQNTLLYGFPRKAGPYIVRIKYPPHYRLPANTHPDDRTYTVLSGTLYEGYGAKFDEAKLVAYPAGSFLTYSAGQMRFLKSGDEELVLQVSGTGPTDIAYVDPADDPRKR